MTNIEKVKRILDAGHWVKVTFEDGETTTITSCLGNEYSYIDGDGFWIGDIISDWSTIEVIQRIPTPYVASDKVLVLSNPSPDNIYKEAMAWKVCEVYRFDSEVYHIYELDKSDHWEFPAHCLAPVFDDEEISDMNRIISGKEAKIVIDGKEYSVTLKLI